ncbi:hypothetical protein [Tenuifilum thalassicum]|uniref:GNAT family N-acetyltransferase n=1 Tax=Tenuifilum thalassicum TaxID=2590900 RepID=A0A7D3XLG8_9BACT|nr:hypothetical protein [Tenuifilum thalassicum]QKG80435.1 hypothetical protein FHG85_09210 [Tenuifilum thalassicum]
MSRIPEIVFVTREEIIDELWNKGIESAFNSNIYAYTWYLDIVSPGWSALITDNYDYLFPLPTKKKYGINYIIQPLYCQQLGLYSSKHITPELVDTFIDNIPSKFKYVNINLNIHNKTDKHKSDTNSRVTYMLDLLNYDDQIFPKYKENTKRNILKAFAKNHTITTSLTPSEFISFYKYNGHIESPAKEIKIIKQLIECLIRQQKLTLLGCINQSNEIGSVALFAENNDTIYYLLGARNKRIKSSSLHFLLDYQIKNRSGLGKTLDFEGSMIPSIAHFFSGFGAKPCKYLNYTKNSIPASDLILRLKKELGL